MATAMLPPQPAIPCRSRTASRAASVVIGDRRRVPMKPPPVLKHKPPPGIVCGKGKDARKHPFQFAAGGQFEGVKSGLPAGTLLSMAHIFLYALSAPAGHRPSTR